MTNTREKLIEVKRTLEMCYKQGITSECNGCAYRGHNNVCMDALMEDALAVINHLESNVSVQQWIPVREPPKKDGRYLVAKKLFNNSIFQEVLSFAKDGRKVDKYDFHRGWKNVWYRYDSEWGHLTIDDVTHWMPLPDPPKGE